MAILAGAVKKGGPEIAFLGPPKSPIFRTTKNRAVFQDLKNRSIFQARKWRFLGPGK